VPRGHDADGSVTAGNSEVRDREDGLGWVGRALFGDERLRVDVDRPAPPGMSAVERYVVVPSLARPRFLLPVAPRPARTAALLAYNRLRPPAVRRRRAAVAGAVSLSPTLFGRLRVLTVWAPTDVAPAEVSIARHVSGVLGDRLYAAIGIHPPDPNAKPTLQMVDGSGKPRAYVKVGWNVATRALVATEFAALRDAPRAPDHPITPAVLHLEDTAARTYVAAAPLPTDVRGMRVGAPPEVAAILAVARRSGGPAPSVQLRASPLAERLTGDVHGVLSRHGSTALELGTWHGDWVPWNLGWHGDRLVAWDWEHSGSDMPVGSDLAHQAFQVALTVGGASAATATRAAEQALTAHAGPLGLAPAAVPAVLDVYLAELWLRTARLAAGGGGWNPRLHPALLDVLEHRLR
jgi:hypothetical protein